MSTPDKVKAKFRVISRDSFYHLYTMLEATPPILDRTTPAGTRVWMLDDDMLPTQAVASLRWLLIDTQEDAVLFQVDNAGDAIQIFRAPL